MSTTAAEPAQAFAARDWGMLVGVAVTWGGSFLLIEIGLDHFAPTLVAFGRIAFGRIDEHDALDRAGEAGGIHARDVSTEGVPHEHDRARA